MVPPRIEKCGTTLGREKLHGAVALCASVWLCFEKQFRDPAFPAGTAVHLNERAAVPMQTLHTEPAKV